MLIILMIVMIMVMTVIITIENNSNNNKNNNISYLLCENKMLCRCNINEILCILKKKKT